MKKYKKGNLIKPLKGVFIGQEIIIDNEKHILYKVAKSEEEALNNGWEIYYNIDENKHQKIQEIVKYDKSEAVNTFIINGINAWIDRNTRASLMNSTNILKNSQQENTTLWLDNKPYVLNCDLLIQMLGALEIYALQCYNVTEQHKANVNAFESIEDVQNYDFKVGYPDKLVFNV